MKLFVFGADLLLYIFLKVNLFYILLVILVVVIALTFAQQKPDCVSLARQVPEDISKYYYHHDSDCNKFYQCAEYGLVLKECPEDQHFDRNLYICGYPEDINC